MPLAVGLMSGTSCDGISAALVRIDGRRVQVLAHRTTDYPDPLRKRLAAGQHLTAQDLSALTMELGERFAQAALGLLRRSRMAARRIAVIGSHGHTLYHGPRDRVPSTLQIGEPAVIAERTGIPVMANFRARDVAAGGEGAPLVPYFDEAVFGGGPIRALQNLGGIANVTVVGRRVTPLAFDTGPGNCLIDLMAQRASGGRTRYDPGGTMARRGRVDHDTVWRLWHQPYFQRPPPKSTGRELFNRALLRRVFTSRLRTGPYDVLATVTYFTAFSIAESYRRFVPHPLTEVTVSGGGVRNRTLMAHLTRLLAPVPLRSIAEYGIAPQAKEPAAFAFLAWRALRGRLNHLPATTGARRACVLGSLTPGTVR